MQLSAALIIIASIIVGAWIYGRSDASSKPPVSSPVSESVNKSVNFPVYYPDQGKLPVGYALVVNSITSPVKNGVSYAVSYDNDKKIVFSVQAKPSDDELESFRSNFIPLRIAFQTALGQGEIGAYNNQTLVSLPVVNGPWIVITAPPDINQNQLKQVVHALKASD